MQKLLLKISPLLLVLMLFSCAKDNDLKLLPEQVIQEQTLQAKGKPCTVPCRKPDWINVGKVGSCTAILSWSYSSKVCGTFVVQLYNHSTQEWTYYNPATSPLNLVNLDPCTQYTVGVSHVTDQCASIPLKISFQTECKDCKSKCDIPCKPLDYFSVDNLSSSGATINFGHDPFICGTFAAQLKNNQTGVITYHDPVTSPWVLTGLDICTSYSLSISHVTGQQACLPVKRSFSTSCAEPPCEIEVLSGLTVLTDQLGFNVPGVVGYADNDFQCTSFDGVGVVLCPSEPYMIITDPVLRLEPGVDFEALFCYMLLPVNTLAPVDINIWVDFNDDGTFSNNELIVDFSFSDNSGLCISEWEAENIPTQEVCEVPARYIISLHNEIVSPCDDVQSGQVIDFLVNIGDCDIAP